MLQIIKLIKQNPYITSEEMAKQIGVSKRAIINNAIKLKSIAILERSGSAKNEFWKIVNKE